MLLKKLIRTIANKLNSKKEEEFDITKIEGENAFADLVDAGEKCKKAIEKFIEKSAENEVVIENGFNLTRKEVEILVLVSKGSTSQQIANELNRSKFTIDVHRKNILSKTNSANMTEAITKVGV